MIGIFDNSRSANIDGKIEIAVNKVFKLQNYKQKCQILRETKIAEFNEDTKKC